MNKNLYEKINDEDFNLDSYEKIELNDLEKIKMKKDFKNNTKKKNRKKYIAVAAALTLTIGLFNTEFGNNAYAAAESIFYNINYSLSNAIGNNKNLDKYTSIINKEVYDNGVSIKINEVAINRNELMISTNIKLPAKVEGFHYYQDIFINGKPAKETSSTGTLEDAGNNIYNEMTSTKITDLNNTDNLDIKIKIRKIETFNGDNDIKKIKGKWDFDFTTSGAELTKNTKNIPISETININNTNITFTEYSTNDFGQVIYAHSENSPKISYDYRLVGKDNLGNDVEFYLNESQNNNLLFKNQSAIDEKASELYLNIESLKLPEQSGKITGTFKKGGEITLEIK